MCTGKIIKKQKKKLENFYLIKIKLNRKVIDWDEEYPPQMGEEQSESIKYSCFE